MVLLYINITGLKLRIIFDIVVLFSEYFLLRFCLYDFPYIKEVRDSQVLPLNHAP